MEPTATAAVTRALLHGGRSRSIFLERAADGSTHVVKRFHAQKWLRRLGDKRRAQREHRMSRHLSGLGLAVPNSLGVTHARDGAWEIALEHIQDAVRLEDLGNRPGPDSRARMATRLGVLIAGVHGVGLNHGDLHGGNILFDHDGKPWLIDVARACIQPKRAVAGWVEDLVALASATREFVDLGLRRRFLLAWRAALPAESRAQLPGMKDLGQKLEGRARHHRRRAIAELESRWLRPSAWCRSLKDATGLTVLTGIGVKPSEESEFVDWAASTALAPDPVPHPIRPNQSLLVREGGRESERDWVELGRASRHYLPCAEPLMLLKLGPQTRFIYALPAGSRSVYGEDTPGVTATALGRVAGALHDRGFATVAPAQCLLGLDGGLHLGPGTRLREVDKIDLVEAAHGSAFREAYLAEQLGPNSERQSR